LGESDALISPSSRRRERVPHFGVGRKLEELDPFSWAKGRGGRKR
jgi:hypothetical protein